MLDDLRKKYLTEHTNTSLTNYLKDGNTKIKQEDSTKRARTQARAQVRAHARTHGRVLECVHGRVHGSVWARTCPHVRTQVFLFVCVLHLGKCYSTSSSSCLEC
jgi:hypothetical protein